jgi:pilus assembly protein CpaE
MSDQRLFLVVSDDPQVSRSIAQVVDTDDAPDIDVACCSLDEAIRRFDEDGADAVLMDLDPAPKDRLNEVKLLADRAKGTTFLVMASSVSNELVLEAMRVGARDFLEKGTLCTTLPGVLRRVDVTTTNGQVRHALVTVLSAKGGCGATTIAINLTQELHELTEEPTLLVDLDAHYGGAATYLEGLSGEYGVADVLQDADRIDAHLIRSTAVTYGDSWQVLLGPVATSSGVPATQNMENLGRLLRGIRQSFAYAVVDAPRVTAATAALLVKSSVITLLVLEANVLEVRSARSQLDALVSAGADDRLILPVVNRYRRGKRALDLTKIKKALGKERIFDLSNDYKATLDGVNYGKTLSEVAPRSPMRRELRKLAEAIAEARSSGQNVQDVI